MAWLTLILFLPWFIVLGGLYWYFPRQPRPMVRKVFDGTVLLLSLLLAIGGMLWGHAEGASDASSGPIWRQVLAVLYAYGGFLAVLCIAIPLRMRLTPNWGAGAR